MSKESLVQRMLTANARVDSHRVRQGTLRDADFTQLARAAGILQTLPALDRRHAVAHAARDALQGAAAQDRQRPQAGHRGLPAAHAEPGARREPGAGDLRHLALAQGARARAADPGHRALAALARVGAARRRAEADPLRPARLGRHRAGRRPRHLHPPARVLRPGGRVQARARRGHAGQEPQRPHRRRAARFVREYTRFDNLSNREEPE